jgi:esterase
MKLHYHLTGEGRPLFILHGLFGLSDNWVTFTRRMAEDGFACYAVDLRNHGRSPHSMEFSYDLMQQDLLQLMDDLSISKASVLGHSMGGKAAMFFAMDHPQRVEKLVVADISPRYYPVHHTPMLQALKRIHPEELSSRNEAAAYLRNEEMDEATIQFLLKNLYRNDDGSFDWRFNLAAIENNIDAVGEALPPYARISVPALFVLGERSNYVTETDREEIKRIFSNVHIESVAAAGHWVHAENPEGFYSVVRKFLG